MTVEVEIKSDDLFVLNEILKIAEECGGKTNRLSPLMYGYTEYNIPISNCNKEVFEKLFGVKGESE